MALIEAQHEYSDAIPWQSVTVAAALPVDTGLRKLVTATGSLTRCLRDSCGSAFRLELLGERNRRDAPGLIREVVMMCGNSPWVFAQTVIPEATLVEHPWLRGLGNRPLGDSLFERSNVVRDELFLARLTPDHALFERALAGSKLVESPPSLWARRSVIRLQRAALSINEVFFPDAGHCPKV